MRTISIISLKGGVAKTTTSVNMAYILYQAGYRVLLIDNDKQGNASKTFGLYDPNDQDTIARAMSERNIDTREIIKETAYSRSSRQDSHTGRLNVITANMGLLEANLRTIVDTGRQQQTRFKKALDQVKDQYNFCIIDNAPDINMSIINALVISDDVIIPIMIDQYSFDGLDILTEQIEQVKEDFNPALSFRGCLITQYKKTEVQQQGADVLNSGYPIFQNRIRRTENKVNESTFAGKPVVEYSVRCGASQDYKKFVQEYLEILEG
ncbi:MAG: ParA family protein [Lachnospiraceae bacterium]|nr:ParA family protein [Lachnospiraceae bacterium]